MADLYNKKPIWQGNRWCLRVQVNGRTKAFISKTPGAAGRRDVLNRYEAYLDGTLSTSIRGEDAFEKFLNHQIGKNGEKAASTLQIAQYGRLYIVPKIERRRIDRLTIDDWQDIINSAKPVAGRARTNKLSKKTIKTIKSTLIQFIKYCVGRGFMDPLKSELYLPAGHETQEKTILQPEQIAQLFSPDLDGYWLINYYRLACVTGLRPGEVRALKWTDIKFIPGIISINRSVNVRDEITPGKNANAIRSFAMTDLAREILNHQKERTQELDSEWVFPNQIGQLTSHDSTVHCWDRIKKRTGIECTMYGLRHTFISMVQYDVPVEMIKAIVGHSVSMDTFGTYGHHVSGDMERTKTLVDDTLKKIVTQERMEELNGNQ